jgi:hypothetical protein
MLEMGVKNGQKCVKMWKWVTPLWPRCKLNNRPRKYLGFKTPNEVFFGIKPKVALQTWIRVMHGKLFAKLSFPLHSKRLILSQDHLKKLPEKKPRDLRSKVFLFSWQWVEHRMNIIQIKKNFTISTVSSAAHCRKIIITAEQLRTEGGIANVD